MKPFLLRTLTLPVCASAAFALALASGRADAAGFEKSEGYAPGSDITTSAGWAKSAPAAGKITDALARSGEQSLRIPASPDAERAASTAFSPPKDGVIFLDFYLRPVADASKSPLGTVDANGALLGFLKDGEEGSIVAVVAPAPAQKNAAVPPSNAKETAVRFPLDEQNTAIEWIRLTIRQDVKAKTWDLFVNGELKLIDQPLAGPPKKAAALSFYASAQADTFVDDLVIGAANPLFPDADQDGIPDAVEMVNGTNAYYNDRNGDSNGDKVPNIESFRRGELLSLPASSARRIVYIDSKAGSDQATGEDSYIRNGRGPKGSLRGAGLVKGNDVVFVLMPSDKPYVCPNYPPGKAPNVSYVLLGNATLTGE